jgi:hypothetical protein
MRSTGRLIARTTIDAAAGLALFIVFAVLASGGASYGGSPPFDGVPSLGAAGDVWANGPAAAKALMQVAPQPPDPANQASLYLLAAVFSALVAFNLAFFRHLRRVYAAPPSREEDWS